MRVAEGVKVKLFEHGGFKGKVVELEAGNHDMDVLRARGFDNKASSVIVEEKPGGFDNIIFNDLNLNFLYFEKVKLLGE